MNCRHAEQLQSYRRDHSLPERDQVALVSHLTQCVACRRREERYRELVGNLPVLDAVTPGADLLLGAMASLETRSIDRSRLFSSAGFPRRKENRIMWMRSMATAALLVVSAGATLVGTRQQQAYGQTVLQDIKVAVSRARTAHIVSWLTIAGSRAEAQYDEWHEGKTPVRTELWAKDDAERTWDAMTGPALWTSGGFLAYDRQDKKVEWRRTERTFAEIREDNVDPLAFLKTSPLPGIYRKITVLGETQRRGHRVRTLQIESGPEKPAINREAESPHPPRGEAKLPSPEAASRSARPERWTYWVDRVTNLPVCREHTVQIDPVYTADGKLLGRKWVEVDHVDYDFNVPIPKNWLDVNEIRKAAVAFGATGQLTPQP